MKRYDKNKGKVIWLTGLPCSGKTSISKELEKYFKKNNKLVVRLDGDVFRKKQSRGLGFSKKDRDKNIKMVANEAKNLSKNGVNVIAAFVSPYQKMRSYARKICPNFIEVYVQCGIEECMRRDVKGMYKKALSGKLKHFTGISDPYEEPRNPEFVLKTEKYSVKKNAERLIQFLEMSDIEE